MFNRISSLVLAIAMFMVFWGSVRAEDNFNVFLTSLPVLIGAITIINMKRLGFSSWSQILLPIIYVIGMGCIFAVLPETNSEYLRLTFLIIASIVLFGVEMQLGRESHFLQNVYLFSAFSWFLGLFAFAFYLNLSTTWTVGAAFFAAGLLILQGFAGFSLPAKKYFNFLVALVCAQVTWGLLFWPNHYLVKAVVLFCVFYLLWIFSFSAFFGKLSIKKIYWQLTLVFIVLLITLATAAWEPLNT